LAEVQPHLRDTAVLGLVVAEMEYARAVEVLTAHGISAQMNRTHLLVTIDAANKAEPIRVLLAAGIAVRDFDLEYHQASRSGPEGG
jgi:hypothetical protein